MAMTFKAGGASNPPCPSGTHLAVCNLIADLGYQPSTFGDKHQVYIRWEIPAERFMKDGKDEGPVVIGKRFTASMHEKASLRQTLEGWRGRKFSDEEAEQFDVSAILGKACTLNVVHNVKDGKLYANIASVSPLMKGVTAPECQNPPLYYASDNLQTLKELPDWIQEMISKQVNLARDNRDKDAGYVINDGTEITDDDIPF